MVTVNRCKQCSLASKQRQLNKFSLEKDFTFGATYIFSNHLSACESDKLVASQNVG